MFRRGVLCDGSNASPRRAKAGYVFLGATVLISVLLQQSLEHGQHDVTHVGGVERRELDALHVLNKPV